MLNKTAAIGLALLASGLAGCSQYLHRKDSVALSAGNAVQTNIVAHLIDPWPPHARNRAIAFDGDRLQGAVVRYRRGAGDDRRPGEAPVSPGPTSPGGGAASNAGSGSR